MVSFTINAFTLNKDISFRVTKMNQELKTQVKELTILVKKLERIVDRNAQYICQPHKGWWCPYFESDEDIEKEDFLINTGKLT